MSARVALVTGCGKRDGMGRAIALTLAASGTAVAIADRQPGGVPNRRQELVGLADDGWTIDSLAGEITSSGGTAMVLLGDISETGDARRMVEEAAAWHGRLDILVNVAAAPQGLDRQDIEDVPVDVWDSVIAINLRGTYLMARFAVPHMRAQRWGRIINISSQAGQVAAPKSTAYSASKAGVLGFTRALSADVAPWGITVNAIAPGMVATSRSVLSIDPALDVDAEVKRRGAMLAVGRPGYPEDIAAAVAYLASDGAGYMTGQTLVLDGGGAAPFATRPPEAVQPGTAQPHTAKSAPKLAGATFREFNEFRTAGKLARGEQRGAWSPWLLTVAAAAELAPLAPFVAGHKGGGGPGGRGYNGQDEPGDVECPLLQRSRPGESIQDKSLDARLIICHMTAYG